MKSLFIALFSLFISTLAVAQVEDAEQQKQLLAEQVVDKSHMMDAISLVIDSMVESSTDLVFSESAQKLDKDLYIKNASQILATQFSYEELEAMSNFYSTEIGASIARKMPYYQATMGKILENMIVDSSEKLSLE